jgi:hypothetical protein
MRSIFVVCAIALLSGCARLPGGGSDRAVEVTVNTGIDSTLRVAATQLQHHGYIVTPAGENRLVTAPRAVPDYLVGKDAELRNRQWFVQVSADRSAFVRGTRLSVTAFLIPPTAAGTTAPQVQNAIPVTSDHQLWQEVRSIARWIQDGARR